MEKLCIYERVLFITVNIWPIFRLHLIVCLKTVLQDLFASTLKPVEKVLTDGDVKAKYIDEIVLIGGSTRIPKVQQLVKEFFNGKVSNCVTHCTVVL